MLWARVTLAFVVCGLVGVIALPNRLPEAETAAVAVPSADAFLEASTGASDALRTLEQAILAFRAERGAWPGWERGPDGPRASSGALVRDLTASGGPGRALLGHGMPTNPRNGLATVHVLGAGEPWPADGQSAGWIYDPRSGRIGIGGRIRPGPSHVGYFP